MRAPHRLNRSLLLVIALVLVAAGAAGLCAALGVFGTALEHGTLFDNRTGRYVGREGAWLWPVAAVVAVLVGLLALRWLAAQASTERAGTLELPSPDRAGTTTLRSGALTDALEHQIAGYHGVADAWVAMRGDAGRERLELRVTLADRVDLIALRTRIETGALADARTALGDPRFPVHIAYDITTRAPTRDL